MSVIIKGCHNADNLLIAEKLEVGVLLDGDSFRVVLIVYSNDEETTVFKLEDGEEE